MRVRVASLLVAAAACCAHVAKALVAPASGPVVDLGYAKYQGYFDDSHQLNVWKSVRYAAPPVGKLRWQAPQPIQAQRCNAHTIPATEQPPLCPQSGAFGTPTAYGFNSGPGNEDCLYLNVYAAKGATSLPVMVWIHGGGYSVFGANYDPSMWLNANGNGFIHVEIQYRLGAFGFLASSEIRERGRLNVGLLDQRFALQWVQEHVAKFGGDPRRVTLGGESSGAGSVMYQALAYGGEDSRLFDNLITASPYTPAIHRYDDVVISENYNALVEATGCDGISNPHDPYHGVFDCLVMADSGVLQNASATVSTSRGYYGSFAFMPVVDGTFIQQRPSEQLYSGRVSGKRLLVGNNANEGVPLTNPEIDTRPRFNDFITATFPLFSEADVDKLNRVYQIDDAKLGNDGVRYDTLGNLGPTALTQSSLATGIQQAAFNIAAESLFNCPAQWLAEAFSQGTRKAWKYQYSPTPSYHGADLPAYFSQDSIAPSPGFRYALRKILGNFVIHNSPIISVLDATNKMANATVPVDQRHSDRIEWPEYTTETPWQMNLNTTGGWVTLKKVTDKLSYFVRVGEGIVNSFRLVDAWEWEGGRGRRCEFWRTVASRVPQ